MSRIPPPEDERCTGINRDGSRCKMHATTSGGTCRKHDPDYELPDEQRCTGIISGGYDHQERAGERCRAPRLTGLPVCKMHGGGNKRAQQIGRMRVAEEKLMASASKLVGTPVENPLTELAALAGRARALMDLLEGRVEALLDAESGDENAGEAKGGIRYKGGAGEQIRGEVQLYERSMDRLGKLLVDIGRLNIDERLAKVTDAQAQAVMAAVEAAIDYLVANLGVCPHCGHAAGDEHETKAYQIAARKLHAVPS